MLLERKQIKGAITKNNLRFDLKKKKEFTVKIIFVGIK